VSGLSWDLYLHPFSNFHLAFYSGYYDLLYVLTSTAIFCGLIFIFKKFPRVQKVLALIFGLAGLLTVIIAILNIRIVEALGKPFNYQWLYYSDFLQSADSRFALTANLSSAYLSRLVLLIFGFLFLICLSYLMLLRLRLNVKSKRITITICLFLGCIYAGLSKKTITEKKWDYEKLANPVTAFLESVSPFSAVPQLFTMKVEDSLKFETGRLTGKKASIPPTGIRNVLLFVMESTPSEYVYGSKFDVTPNLKKHIGSSLVFENIYAHAPATNLSMVSLLGSVYPWLSYNSFTQEHPDMKIATISSELKKEGYRTGFFNSADNRFQRAGEFLSFRDFDSISDCRNISCSDGKFSLQSDWEYMDGKSDACTAEDLFSWIGKDKSTPFFGMMWTYQTHYPYFFSGEQKYYDADPFFNRYLNALHNSDLILGKLLADLEKNDLAASTLVIVVGDHGEAFGRHEQVSHGRKIYEENLHVPCIFINPAFTGQRFSKVGGLVDIAPTILGLLGRPSPVQWQGNDLFVENSRPRAYFFAPWSDYLFGYREANRKYIYNATKNTTEIYDLATDQLESNDLSGLYPSEVVAAHQRLAAWTQYVNASTASILEKAGTKSN
jgi:lipoteichoic acid synthase